MHHVLVMGAGKIGSLLSLLLSDSTDYDVHLADIHPALPYEYRLANLPNLHYTILDAADPTTVSNYIKKNNIEAIVSCLPFYCNAAIANLAADNRIHYFDLTEDVETTKIVKGISKNTQSAFVPQSGLAPGFISIVANHLMKNFPELDTVKMRVGALPINISNALQYSLTWSTEGLINEYGNPCYAIENGEPVTLEPLEGLEEIKIDGLTYEAFNTSGGIGSLAQSYFGRVQHISYKTIRYPGHCEKVKFLMNDLKLNNERDVLKHILENALPITFQDVVLVYVSVTGTKNSHFIEENYVKKFYSTKIKGHHWSAIQLTTASNLCAILDIIMNNPGAFHGLVLQEQFSLDDVINNRFGNYLK